MQRACLHAEFRGFAVIAVCSGRAGDIGKSHKILPFAVIIPPPNISVGTAYFYAFAVLSVNAVPAVSAVFAILAVCAVSAGQ